MPIHFLVQPGDHIVRVTYAGIITLTDLSRHVQRLVHAKLLHRPRLVDSRNATFRLTGEDIRIFSSLMSTLHARFGCAPVAFVPGDESWYSAAEVYRDLGAGGNPRFASFPDMEAAQTWLLNETN
jgi:hypothetical protein